jgi:hypothetical protein
MNLLDDPRIHTTLNRSKLLAKQHKPFIAFLLFASFVFLCHLPSDRSNQNPSSSPAPTAGSLRPYLNPIFNQSLPQGSGSLEIIPERESYRKAKWAKVAVASGFEDVVYERALETHIKHAEKHSYPMYVGRENAADGMFNKIAYILHVMLQELYKPAEERIEWLL